jgi:hypothetical protein
MLVDDQETERARVSQQGCHHSVQQQRQQWKWVLCYLERRMLECFHSFIYLFVDAVVGRIRKNQSFTPGRHLSSILLHAWTILTRENPTQPTFADLTTRMYSMSFTLGNSNLVLSIPSAKHGEVSCWILFTKLFTHNVHNLKVKLENFVEGSARQQWEFTRVSDLQPIR